MTTITQCFQPPLYWQQFEDLTEGVFRFVYGDPKPTKFGRPGQAQNGVDVFGRLGGKGQVIGIQCKRMDERDENNQPRPGGKILKNHLSKEISAASKFTPALGTWILATTAKRDAAIQRYALKLDEKSRLRGSFGIQVWFWDDFITDLNRYYELQRWYYKDVIQVQTADDQDKIILELLGEAFSRAAFRMPLNLETPSEFIQALKDTQHAINTGELKDRETRRVIRKTIGGRRAIASDIISDHLRNSDDKLHQLRELFESSLNQSAIKQYGSSLLIPPELQSKLDTLRSDAVAEVNRALNCAGLRQV